MVELLTGLAQLAIVLGLSGTVAYWLGGIYLAIAGLVVVTSGVLLVEASRRQFAATAAMEAPPNVLTEMISIAAMSIGLGLVWPALPLIVAWSAHREAVESPPDRQPPLR